MPRTLASCKLSYAAILPVLKRHGLMTASSPGTRDGSGVVRTDSRAVTSGDIFLAYKGVAADGHTHIPKALAQGAGFLIVEDPHSVPTGTKTPWAAVTNGRAAWSHLAAEAFGNPQEKLTLVGVTGTNGKSSTVWMVGELLRSAGYGCLTIGTLGAYFGDDFVPTRHTTPDPDVLYALLAEAVRSGIKIAAMEASSHAIFQEKVAPIRYAATGFTSFTRDHLDLHGTMEEYWAQKWRLFTELSRPDARHVFADVLPGQPRLSEVKGETFVYGHDVEERRSWQADNFLKIVEQSSSFAGTKLTLTAKDHEARGFVPYFARHALENFAAAYLLASKAAGLWLGSAHWAKLRPVPGRLEQVLGGAGSPCVVVDYAHTPDALEKTLEVLRPICKGRLSVVFGCGGDRDRGKRPMMGEIAERLADKVYVTSDNPRTEDPKAIIAEICGGLAHPDRAVALVDRAAAIGRAIADSKVDDLVLVAGKGHETYQIIGDKTLAFDDREVARGFLTGKDHR